MTSNVRNAVVLAVVQAALVGAVGVGAAIDRHRLPRAVVEVVAASANPVEGRYLVARLQVPAPDGWNPPSPRGPQRFTPSAFVDLTTRDGRLIAVPGHRYHVDVIEPTQPRQPRMIRLVEPVRLYLGPSPVDPFHTGEARWMEVSLPTSGLPRPIRLSAAPRA